MEKRNANLMVYNLPNLYHFLHVYIYIYMCVCVCVRVRMRVCVSLL